MDEARPPEAEPEADFSWLDAPEPAEDEADDAPVSDTPLAPAEAAIVAGDGGSLAEARLPVDPAAPIPEAAPISAIAAEDTSERDEFAWLDAPLPPEEPSETATSSALGSDAPDRADVALPAAAGALPGLVSPPLSPLRQPTDGEGWALRERERAEQTAPEVRKPFFQRLREGLARSSNQLSGQITALFTKRKLDEETLQEFEDVLIQADLGVETAMRITDRLSDGRFGKEISGEAVRQILADEVERALAPVAKPLELDLEVKPHVILVVGVNGTGKTTTIGKLAAKLTRGGLKVTLGAGDTFRAAAVEQLKIWGERTGSTVVARQIGADAAGLAFEAYDEAVANGSDVLIIDTAGRLQNRAELMDELAKIVRVLQKRDPDSPHTVLQTLDATTGQNALNQVEIFRNVAGVNGLVMTKLDGTARGGILVAIAAKHKLPVFFVGVGEGVDDLEPFKARDFADAIAGRAGTV
ncbi:signal recognition particle-docking protein FtsY [Aureimonas sp. N4]|uniref:signal recognition particle-docking protein FtsY n=1 Tax=Aureimonas sp. N4 TaxID=1638165 RepID=UPI0035B53780